MFIGQVKVKKTFYNVVLIIHSYTFLIWKTENVNYIINKRL